MQTPSRWRTLAGRTLAPVARCLTGGTRVLFYHRFSATDVGERRLPVAEFEAHLQYLTRHFEPLPLTHVLRCRAEGRALPRNAVAVTVDDAYTDFADLAYPLLERYRVPATLFVVSQFAAGGTWLWFDRLRVVIDRTNRPELVITQDARREVYTLRTAPERDLAWDTLATRCLRLAPEAREDLIAGCARQLEVVLPPAPPPEFAGLTLPQLRALDRRLLDYGSHSRTHPILSTLDTAALKAEIVGCQRELNDFDLRPCPIYCYPNGKEGDYDARVTRVLRDGGFQGAVTAISGRLTRDTPRWEIPRLGASSRMPEFRHEVDGLSELQARWRAARAGTRRTEAAVEALAADLP